MHRLLLCICAILALWFMTPTGAHAASDSAGTEFFIAFQPNTAAGTSNLSLFITGQQDTQGMVEIPGLNFSQAFTVQANRVTTVNLPSSAQSLGSNSIARLGVRVTAQSDVTVYGLNQRQYTTDAFLSLPSDILGLEYLAMSYPSTYSSYPSQVAVVGVYDNTQVTITPSAAATGRPAGVPFTITLNRLDTFQLTGSGTADLTGSIIATSAPVAVMSGVNCVNVPVGVGWCDHIVEMMPPVATWGKSFLTVPLATRLKGDVFRVLASQDGTTVHINGVLAATLNRGKFYEKVLTARSQIEASAPVLVAQYSPGQGFDNVISDPFMMLIPPTEQFLNHYTFSTPASGFTKNFVNVVVPTSAISSLRLDGSPINTALFSSIGSSGFSGAQVPVSLGSHTISGDVAFGIYVYGFGSYDSYGYPGGMAFQFINPMGDTDLPNVRLSQIGDTIQGTATDSEDINANGILDAGEDLNGNGSIDRRSEDVNGNGKLDSGEDLNGNGFLDRDTGIFKVELEPGSSNLQLNVLSFIPGALSVNFSITLIDPKKPGTGVLGISDGVGNSVQAPISLSGIPTLKDVRVIDTISTNNIEIDQASFSKPPFTITTAFDKTIIEWRYDSFPANLIEDMSFDVIFKNPIAGEQRIVSHKLELLYTDANGKQVRTELGSQYVKVLNSAFDSSVITDKATYQANEAVVINVNIQNLSEYTRTVDAKILIEDSQGALVEEVASLSALNFTAGEMRNLGSFTFNTKTSHAGEYKAHLILYENKTRTGEAFTNFNILAVKQAASAITADKMAYSSNESVVLTSAITSKSPNSTITNLRSAVTVTDPSGNTIFTEDRILNDLMPEARVEFKSFTNTQTHPAGLYTAALLVSSNGEYLTGASTSFEIISSLDQAKALSGTIKTNPASIFEKESTTLTYTIQNTGNEYDLPLILTEILIVDPDTQLPVRTMTGEASLNGREVFSNAILFDSTGLAPKPYLIILQGTTAGVTQTISSIGLIINPIPNNAPIANAGPDQSAFAGHPVLLDGSQSTDPDGDPLSFIWHFTLIPNASQTTDNSLLNSMTATPSFVPDAEGIYTLSLVVNDGLADSQTDTVSVFVNPAPKVDIHPETINLKSKGGSISVTAVLTSPVLSSFTLFTQEDGITVTAIFSMENTFKDKSGNTVTFTIPNEDYTGDDTVVPVDADNDGDTDFYQLTLKLNRDHLVAGFTGKDGQLLITEPTALTSTIIGNGIIIGSDVNTVISPSEVSKGGK